MGNGGGVFGGVVGLLMLKIIADAFDKEEKERLDKKRGRELNIKIPRIKI